MSDFTDAYRDLLIKQYWDQPNARAEIELQARGWESIRNIVEAFTDAFDLDQAVGAQLDIIGRIVGMPRVIPLVIPKVAFGFDENTNARGFDDKFMSVADVAPFLDKFEPTRTDLTLADNEYRFFIRAKIARNTGSGYMIDLGVSIQDTVSTLFDGLGYVLDNKDMTLTLYVSPDYPLVWLTAILTLDLLPRPQGVRYGSIITGAPYESFGFSDNLGAMGFDDKFDAAYIGGRFADRIPV